MRRSKALKSSGAPEGSAKGTKARSGDSRKRERRFEAAFHSEEYVRFVKSLPCVQCGASPCDVSHDPSRGAGGQWTDTHPLCRDCHIRLGSTGTETFWSEVGITREQANARTHQNWLAYSEGLTY